MVLSGACDATEVSIESVPVLQHTLIWHPSHRLNNDSGALEHEVDELRVP